MSSRRRRHPGLPSVKQICLSFHFLLQYRFLFAVRKLSESQWKANEKKNDFPLRYTIRFVTDWLKTHYRNSSFGRHDEKRRKEKWKVIEKAESHRRLFHRMPGRVTKHMFKWCSPRHNNPTPNLFAGGGGGYSRRNWKLTKKKQQRVEKFFISGSSGTSYRA